MRKFIVELKENEDYRLDEVVITELVDDKTIEVESLKHYIVYGRTVSGIHKSNLIEAIKNHDFASIKDWIIESLSFSSRPNLLFEQDAEIEVKVTLVRPTKMKILRVEHRSADFAAIHFKDFCKEKGYTVKDMMDGGFYEKESEYMEFLNRDGELRDSDLGIEDFISVITEEIECTRESFMNLKFWLQDDSNHSDIFSEHCKLG